MKQEDLPNTPNSSPGDPDLLIRALEARPVVHVPQDFSTRVMQRIPTRGRRFALAQSRIQGRVQSGAYGRIAGGGYHRSGVGSYGRIQGRALAPRYGVLASWLACAAMLVALMVIPFHAGSPLKLAATELLLFVELFCISIWLCLTRYGYL